MLLERSKRKAKYTFLKKDWNTSSSENDNRALALSLARKTPALTSDEQHAVKCSSSTPWSVHYCCSRIGIDLYVLLL